MRVAQRTGLGTGILSSIGLCKSQLGGESGSRGCGRSGSSNGNSGITVVQMILFPDIARVVLPRSFYEWAVPE